MRLTTWLRRVLLFRVRADIPLVKTTNWLLASQKCVLPELPHRLITDLIRVFLAYPVKANSDLYTAYAMPTHTDTKQVIEVHIQNEAALIFIPLCTLDSFLIVNVLYQPCLCPTCHSKSFRLTFVYEQRYDFT